MLKAMNIGKVHLLPGLQILDDPATAKLHWGWEALTCQLRGHFLGDRNQEFCTVYNMVRLADYLYRFTGETVYADYIEKNLYNGFLAQQNNLQVCQLISCPLHREQKRNGAARPETSGVVTEPWCSRRLFILPCAIMRQQRIS